MSGKGFLGNMTENLQADCVQSRQAGFMQCFHSSATDCIKGEVNNMKKQPHRYMRKTAAGMVALSMLCRHAGYPVRQNGGQGLVSHRPCRDDKGTGGQEKVPVDVGLTQTQKSCRVFAAAFFGVVLDISYRA